MNGVVVLVVVFWSVSAVFAYHATRTPWRPPRTDSTEIAYMSHISVRPWGRARYILFSLVLALLGVYVIYLSIRAT